MKGCPSDKQTFSGLFLTISVHNKKQNSHFLAFFYEKSVKTVCLKIFIFKKKTDVFGVFTVILGIPWLQIYYLEIIPDYFCPKILLKNTIRVPYQKPYIPKTPVFLLKKILFLSYCFNLYLAENAKNKAFSVQFLGEESQQSSSEIMFVTRVLRKQLYTPKTLDFWLKN